MTIEGVTSAEGSVCKEQ